MKNMGIESNQDLQKPVSTQFDEIRDYISLLKPRVMSLVIFTGYCGMLVAPGKIHPFLALIAILCIALGSGASGAINMWYERELDKKMKRTKGRALPEGRLLAENAIEFAAVLASISVFMMAFATNFVAAAILLAAILFYVFIYTIWLKPRTPQNIVIGGAAGAFPPMIGWAAVTGNITLEPVLLFLIIFLWTPPHFWALSLFSNQDYKNAGIPMMPVVKGVNVTKRQMLIYTIILFIVSLLPFHLHYTGKVYMIAAAALGINFLRHAKIVYRDPSEKNAKKMFGFSIIYLFTLFLSLVIDHLIYNGF